MFRSELLHILTDRLNLSELEGLCFELGVDPENWPGGKGDKALALLEYLEQHHRTAELLTWLQQKRSDIELPTGPKIEKPLSVIPDELKPYLRWLAGQSNIMPLAPLDPKGRDGKPAPLSQLFINLNVAGAIVHPIRQQKKELTVEKYWAALAHIHARRQFILLGDPGFGKSTLMRFLAYCLAQAALEPAQETMKLLKWTGQRPGNDDNNELADEALSTLRRPRTESGPVQETEHHWSADFPIPVLIELRDFARTPFDPASHQAIWRFVCYRLEKEELGECLPALKTLAQEGQALFLLDGVDEVPLGQRPSVWAAIQAMSRGHYAANRWVATCRILSFVAEEAPAGVPVQTLQKLTTDQIQQFIDNWYAGLVAELGREKANHLADRLETAATGRLLSLAENPMLLTIMALVQTYHGELPTERAKLYKACVETLLLRWQRHKDGEDVLTLLDTTQEKLERLLWEIAWKAHSEAPNREKTADIPEMEVVQIAKTHLGSYEKAEKFLQYTEKRAHLLVGHGGQRQAVYKFPHRTFQEYLAACHLAASRRFPQEAAKLAAQGDTWREVLNLATGTLVFNQNNQEKALDGVQGVLPARMPKPEQEAVWCRVWLAGEMLAAVGAEAAEKDEVGRKLLPKLRKQLAALVETGRLTPRQRAEAGSALGWLGDPRPDVSCEIPFMVEIPAGPFLMGSDIQKDKMARSNEQLQHTIELSAYRIGKYPVTVAQYALFIATGGYAESVYWTEAGWKVKEQEGWTAPRYWGTEPYNTPNQPVVGVSWYEAVAYCHWLAAKTGRNFRLPDEAMWEKAARGADGRIYPWGDNWKSENLNAVDTGIGWPSAVGMFPDGSSPFGIYDACGNVWEWCSGLGPSHAPYPFHSKTWQEDLQADGLYCLRGGAFYDYDQETRSTIRTDYYSDNWLGLAGFRVAEDLS